VNIGLACAPLSPGGGIIRAATQDAMKSIKYGKLAASAFHGAAGKSTGTVEAVRKMIKGEKADTEIMTRLNW